MSVSFAPLLLLVSFFLSHVVYQHYCSIPVEDISTANILFVMAWDIGITLLFHGLCAYRLSDIARRPSRIWIMSVLVSSVLVTLECFFRCVSLAFGEPIYRLVAGLMPDFMYLLLPLVGVGAGIGWRVCASRHC